MTNYGYVPPNAGDVNYGVRVALDKSLRALQSAVAVDANAYTDTKFAAVPASIYQAGSTTSSYSGSPTNGSLYYETSNGRWRYYNGSSWVQAPESFQIGSTTSNLSGTATTGMLFYETSNTAFKFYNGSSWVSPPWALGHVGVASSTTDNSSVSASFADASSLSVTWTALASRRYKYSVRYMAYSTADGDSMEMQITDGSGTVKAGPWRFAEKSAINIWGTHSFVGTETGIGAGSVTRKVQFRREGGSGTVHFGGNGSISALFEVEDIGT